ncbi:hypothetical protein LSH36_194g05016, partial [Paralvinella palmiformis]
RPTIHAIIGNKTVNQGSIIDLRCLVEGHPKASIKWYHNGRRLDTTYNGRVVITESGNRLRIQYSSTGDGGHYGCMAYNEAGSDTKTVELFVRETPLPPFLDKAQAVSRSSINLTWIPVNQEFYTHLSFYVIQYKPLKAIGFTTFRDDVSNQSTSVEVDHLEAGSDYVFRIAARNIIGVGDYSRVIGARTLESAPGSPPVNVLINVLSSSSIKITWQPVPVKLQYGALLGYVVYYRLADTELPLSEQHVKPTTMETMLTGLLPWRYYTISMAAYNAAGSGLRSGVRRVRTLAEGCKVLSFPGNLLPWTVYLIQVQAFTTQVEHGFGPLSIEQRVQTEQDVPGTVDNVQMTIGSTEVRLSWQPPSQPNGMITGYQIAIYGEPSSTETSLIRSEYETVII